MCIRTWGVRAPAESRRHLGATKPYRGPGASPSARHTHDIEFIMSLDDAALRGVREACHFQQRRRRHGTGVALRTEPRCDGERVDSSVSVCV